MFSEITDFSFTTFNASNDVPNGVDYNFHCATLSEIGESDGCVFLVYVWDKFDGNILLSEKYRSESAERKFANKEKREGYVPAVDLGAKEEKPESRDRDGDNLSSWLESEDGEFENKLESVTF